MSVHNVCTNLCISPIKLSGRRMPFLRLSVTLCMVHILNCFNNRHLTSWLYWTKMNTDWLVLYVSTDLGFCFFLGQLHFKRWGSLKPIVITATNNTLNTKNECVDWIVCKEGHVSANHLRVFTISEAPMTSSITFLFDHQSLIKHKGNCSGGA